MDSIDKVKEYEGLEDELIEFARSVELHRCHAFEIIETKITEWVNKKVDKVMNRAIEASRFPDDPSSRILLEIIKQNLQDEFKKGKTQINKKPKGG